MQQEGNIEQEAIFGSKLQLDMESRSYLKEAANWARFLGILGFIATGLLMCTILLFWYANSSDMSRLEHTQQNFPTLGIRTLLFFYFIIIALGFLISTTTFRFGQRTRRAIRSDSQLDFKSGMSNLRFIFRIYGIFSIIYILLLILLITVGSLRNLI